MGYLYIFLTIVFTVYGQLVIKWRLSLKNSMPEGLINRVQWLLSLYTDFWVISGFFVAFLASLTWIATLTKFQLSYAYPFMSMSFILVFILSALLFNESVTISKIIGLAFIILGIIISGKSF